MATSDICLVVKNVVDVDPANDQRLYVTLRMTEAQTFEAIDSLLDSKTPTQRAAWLDRLNEMAVHA